MFRVQPCVTLINFGCSESNHLAVAKKISRLLPLPGAGFCYNYDHIAQKQTILALSGLNSFNKEIINIFLTKNTHL